MNNHPGSGLSDHYLVNQVLSGNTQAFGSIIQNTERLVTQIVCKMVPHTADRKDLVQDIYVKAFHKLSGFKFQSKLSTWIARISYTTCTDYLRKKRSVPADFSDAFHTDHDDMDVPVTAIEANDTLPRQQLAAILKEETARLPPVLKTLITLYHQEELGYEEIVQITGMPVGTVKSYLFRARKALKDRLLVNYKKEDL